jgi:hypothetical protein
MDIKAIKNRAGKAWTEFLNRCRGLSYEYAFEMRLQKQGRINPILSVFAWQVFSAIAAMAVLIPAMA